EEDGEIVASFDTAGSFEVYGNRVLPDLGTYTASITVTQQGTNNSATANGTVTVSAAVVPWSLEGADLDGVEGEELQNVAVAHIQNWPAGEPLAGLTTVIDWGDGTTSAGTIVADNGTISIVGSHTYGDPGSYDLQVIVTDSDGDTSAQGSVFVLDVP